MNTKIIVIFALVCVAALVFRELVSGESLSPNTNQEIGRYTMQVTNDGTIYLLDTREGLLIYGTDGHFNEIDAKSELLVLNANWLGDQLVELQRTRDSLLSVGKRLPDTALMIIDHRQERHVKRADQLDNRIK